MKEPQLPFSYLPRARVYTHLPDSRLDHPLPGNYYLCTTRLPSQRLSVGSSESVRLTWPYNGLLGQVIPRDLGSVRIASEIRHSRWECRIGGESVSGTSAGSHGADVPFANGDWSRPGCEHRKSRSPAAQSAPFVQKSFTQPTTGDDAR